MPTLQDVALAHSTRLSAIHRARDVDVAAALARREARLRALPQAAKAFGRLDQELLAAIEKRAEALAKAAAALEAAQDAAGVRRRHRLEDGERAWRAADGEGLDARRRGEDAAERKYRAAMAALTAITPLSIRRETADDAARVRAGERLQALRAHEDGVARAQARFRDAVDAAVIDERRDGEHAERAHADAARLADGLLAAARESAGRAHAAALADLDEAAAIVDATAGELEAIGAAARAQERAEFERFRRELRQL
jgi:hypothetical protein